ncbi:ABC transporter ATP-binding protein [Tistlia consotensis]|nr:ABC transporter ATP-binding protein [Tistlia consotensis]
MAEGILEIEGLRKQYGPVVAVDGVDLSLKTGEFVTFLGPSGSGKTTTLQIIAGLQSASAGHIRLNGQAIDPLPPHQRNIGVVFQHYALFPHMSIARNIAFPLEMRRVPAAEIRRRVEEALALVGLEGYGQRHPRQLSGGQQQRVALARALVFRPPLLLMDEPLGALDKQLREQMQLEISRLHRELGASIVYVTHDQEEALVMSDRIAVFNHGRIEQIGASEELYERPRSRFVAGFLGESNFFEGRVEALQGELCRIASPAGPLLARRNGDLAVGDPTVVAVRPERLCLLDGSAAGGGGEPENRLEGRVQEVVYLGLSRKYLLRLADGQEVVVRQQAQDAERSGLGPGDLVRLGWRAANANALEVAAGSDEADGKETGQ